MDTIRGLTVSDVTFLVQRNGTNLTCHVSRTSWKVLKKLGNIQDSPPTTPVPRSIIRPNPPSIYTVDEIFPLIPPLIEINL